MECPYMEWNDVIIITKLYITCLAAITSHFAIYKNNVFDETKTSMILRPTLQ